MINFLKYKLVYFLLSATVILAGIFSMARWGFKYSIDFIGGTNLEYQAEKKINQKELNKAFSEEKV